jgi:capsular exopolysaccharide synthesis family protein
MSKVHEALRRAEREREESRRADKPSATAAAGAPAPDARVPGAETPAHPPLPDHRAEPGASPLNVRDGAAADSVAPDPGAAPARLPADVRLAERLVAFTRPRSLAAEQYRAIRQQLAAFGRDRSIRTMVVTSPLAGEGKTITAANLAIALGQDLGRRVCLVDGDLRSPQVQTLFRLSPRDGLADVLRRRTSLEAALVPTPVNDLWLLPAGHLPPNPAELLGSPRMREVVSSLRDAFDLVVLDSPPVLPLPDPAILGGLADGVVMVVLAGRTPRRLIDRALDRLHGTVLLGFVLNRTDEYRYDADYYYYDYGA